MMNSLDVAEPAANQEHAWGEPVCVVLGHQTIWIEWAGTAAGETCIGGFILGGRRYVIRTAPSRLPHGTGRLSRREREIALLIAGGRGTKQIAYDLGISPHTTSTYVNRIRAKLGVRNRPELVAALMSK